MSLLCVQRHAALATLAKRPHDVGMRTALVMALLVSGCVDATDAYRDQLDSLQTTDIVHSDDALRVSAASLGLGPGAVTSLRWVTVQMRDEQGRPVSGVSIGCDIWVSWWGLSGSTGASRDGLAISHTALAHELAHCALGLSTGDRDRDHTHVEWWGGKGRVATADDALAGLGM